MSALIGVAAAFFSGVLNGSFAVPMKLTVKWEWENTWLLYAVSAMVVFPVIITLSTVPGLSQIYSDCTGGVLAQTFLFGFCWGIGSLTLGLGLHMVGLSLGYTIVMGIIAVTGSLIPMLVHDPASFLTLGGILIILAMLVTVAGVALCGAAGRIREKAKTANAGGQTGGSRFKLGLVICVVSGILSAMLNLAFDFGAPIAEVARVHMGQAATAFRANNAIWFLALLGGVIPYLIYCGYLLVTKGTWKRYTQSGTRLYWFWGFLMAAIWISCIMLYGAAASGLGNLGTTVGWLILMSVTVLVGNLWGILTAEWKASPIKARRRMLQGLLLLISSVLIVGFAKYLLQ